MCPVSTLLTSLSSHPSILAVSKGVSANLLKMSSKRRRSRLEIQAEKEAEANKEAEIQKKMAFLAEAQEKLNTFE